jgi:hypothetical protein
MSGGGIPTGRMRDCSRAKSKAAINRSRCNGAIVDHFEQLALVHAFTDCAAPVLHFSGVFS